jgi:hypothetical protein
MPVAESTVIWAPRPPHQVSTRSALYEAAHKAQRLLHGDAALAQRYQRVTEFARQLRPSEYHLSNACNIPCQGTPAQTDPYELDHFLARETTERQINSALVIGGEPALFLDRLRVFARHMRYLSVSSNGLKRLPMAGFENVAIRLPLSEQALTHYRGDPRVVISYALREDALHAMEPTVHRIAANGNVLNFSFYSQYGAAGPAAQHRRDALLAEALRMQALYPQAVLGHPYSISAMITGATHWDSFGYHNCPSISRDHPAHAARRLNANPPLAYFNTWAADLKTVKFCSTTGRCNGCRDSQAVARWLLVSMHHFTDSRDQLATWVDLAESHWSQYCWSPYHRTRTRTASRRQTSTT